MARRAEAEPQGREL